MSGDYTIIKPVKKSENSDHWIEIFVNGETYVHHVSDSANGDHLEIHISASFLRTACEIGVAIVSVLVAPEVAVPKTVAEKVGVVVSTKLGMSACSNIQDGIWINLAYNNITAEWNVLGAGFLR